MILDSLSYPNDFNDYNSLLDDDSTSTSEDHLDGIYDLAFSRDLRQQVENEILSPVHRIKHSSTGAWDFLHKRANQKEMVEIELQAIDEIEQPDFPSESDDAQYLDESRDHDTFSENLPLAGKDDVIETLSNSPPTRYDEMIIRQSSIAFEALDSRKDDVEEKDLATECFPQEGSLPERAYQALDKNDTYIGQAVIIVIVVLIGISGICLCLETLPENRFPNYGKEEQDVAPVFTIIDTVCVFIFTVEYVIRFVTVGFVVRWEDIPAKSPPKKLLH